MFVVVCLFAGFVLLGYVLLGACCFLCLLFFQSVYTAEGLQFGKLRRYMFGPPGIWGKKEEDGTSMLAEDELILVSRWFWVHIPRCI